MKISVSAYSYQALLRRDDVKLSDIPGIAASQGYEGIEFVDFQGELRPQLRELKKACGDAGIPIVAFAAGGNLLEGVLSEGVDQIKASLDLAAEMGAPVMRHDVAYDGGGKRTFAGVLPRLAEGCRAAAEYGGTLGIKVVIENHGRFLQESLRVEALYAAVDHPNFGLLVDIGNFLCADEAPELAVGRLAPFAAHVHAKDFFVRQGSVAGDQGWLETRAGNSLRGTVLGHGDVPLAQCLRVLRREGYNGYVTVEYEGMEDCLSAVEWCRKNLAALMPPE